MIRIFRSQVFGASIGFMGIKNVEKLLSSCAFSLVRISDLFSTNQNDKQGKTLNRLTVG